MMEDRHSRTRILVGERGLSRLADAVVAIAGLGGVGGYALEAIARAGVGSVVLIDFDRMAPSNLNRQLLATEGTMGQFKADVAAERVAAINPQCAVRIHRACLTSGNLPAHITEDITHVIDAIDDVPAKVALLAHLHTRGLPQVACMGAGGLSDPTGIEVADIHATRGCPLARAVRLRLRRLQIHKGVRCVFTPRPRPLAQDCHTTGQTPQGTLSFMPGLIGLTAAGVIINDILA